MMLIRMRKRQPDTDMTKVYMTDAGALRDKDLFCRLYRAASPQRRKKTDGYVTEKDKRLSLAAEALLRAALRDNGITGYSIIYEKNGKPYIEGKNIYFNLSHSETRVICAVSDKEVGCDTELITDIELEIADRFFYRAEKEYIDAITDMNEKKEAFFRLWTLKESFMKAVGMGMELELDSFCVNIENGNITLIQGVDDNRYYFKEYDLDDGYRYAVCGLSPRFADKMRIIDADKLLQTGDMVCTRGMSGS